MKAVVTQHLLDSAGGALVGGERGDPELPQSLVQLLERLPFLQRVGGEEDDGKGLLRALLAVGQGVELGLCLTGVGAASVVGSVLLS